MSYAERIEPFLRTAMEVLRDADRPLAAQEVMDRVGEHVEVAPELTTTNKAGQVRWRVQLGFRTSEAGSIGWLTKRGGWSITEVGRQALEDYPGIELYFEMQRQIRLAGQDGGSGSGGGKLSESKRDELARLRREKADLVKQHAKEKTVWEKERAELEDERDVLKRSVVLWVKEATKR